MRQDVAQDAFDLLILVFATRRVAPVVMLGPVVVRPKQAMRHR